MTWRDLLFMHWPLAPAHLEPLLPPGVVLDTLDGAAWLGIVPFTMAAVRPRGAPSVPGVSRFPELNVRTYVRVRGRPGVWFFSLEASQALAVALARRYFHLPYYRARMRVYKRGDVTAFCSSRTHRGAPRAHFSGRYWPLGGETVGDALTHFLTERYCFYSADRRGRIVRGDVAHRPWQLRPAAWVAESSPQAMVTPLGLALPSVPPLLHHAAPLRVVAHRPVRVL
ncbi:YqjF family protein [Truepera radiovictrix]|nr:DUF2071 domain-containing protein [Truepera radiovictrix]